MALRKNLCNNVKLPAHFSYDLDLGYISMIALIARL